MPERQHFKPRPTGPLLPLLTVPQTDETRRGPQGCGLVHELRATVFPPCEIWMDTEPVPPMLLGHVDLTLKEESHGSDLDRSFGPALVPLRMRKLKCEPPASSEIEDINGNSTLSPTIQKPSRSHGLAAGALKWDYPGTECMKPIKTTYDLNPTFHLTGYLPSLQTNCTSWAACYPCSWRPTRRLSHQGLANSGRPPVFHAR